MKMRSKKKNVSGTLPRLSMSIEERKTKLYHDEHNERFLLHIFFLRKSDFSSLYVMELQVLGNPQ